MQVLIIEDELLSAEDLADTLRQLSTDISIVGILHSVKEAIQYLQSPPEIDLIFSDIQLGDGLSFEIFREVHLTQPVVFCTAFDAYAIEAFKNNGIDYILKPFDNAAVANALAKYRQWKQYFSLVSVDYSALMEKLITRKPEYTAVLVYQKDKIMPVSLPDIALFYIEHETRLFTFDKRSHVVTYTLDQLEKMCGETFFRVNRQYLVNRKAVEGAVQYSPRKFVVDLTHHFPETIGVSKTRTSTFLAWLTQQ